MSSRTFAVKISGDLAVFTRPELKAERVSYEVMTPSAARGVFEAILWKPAIVWVIESIAVLKPIRWSSFRRNEVRKKASPGMADFFADEDRAQRNTVALRDVAYVVRAHFEMTERAESADNVIKFEEMFERRLGKGQCFHQPYLGCREMAARFESAPVRYETIDLGVLRPLGLMFYDFDFRSTPPKPLFFDARLDSGVLVVPRMDAVLAMNTGAAC